jgi:hypothetical protein
MFLLSVLLIAILLISINTKMKPVCMNFVVFNFLCIAAVYYWIYKEIKESYIVRSNVKDISTFLL